MNYIWIWIFGKMPDNKLRNHDYKKAYQAKEQMSNIQKAEILEEEELLL